MSQNLIYLLAEDGKNAFASLIRGFFGDICRFLYRWIGNFIDLMYQIAGEKYLGLGNFVETMANKLFTILVIFMVFKLTITFFNYIVDPDSFTDNSKGIQNVIKRVIISIILLISIQPIFSLLYDIQKTIIDEQIIENFVLGSTSETIYKTDTGRVVYLSQFSPICNEIGDGRENYRTISFSKGEHLAILTLRPFMQPVREEVGNYEDRISDLKSIDYCGVDPTNVEYIETTDFSFQMSFGGMRTTDDYLRRSVYNKYTGDWSLEKNVYIIDFNYFFALIIGIVVALVLISFCFDVVIRAFTLMILEIFAPIPIISYISPKGKSSEMLGTWWKKVIGTWVSLFIKILALTLAITFISAVCDSNLFSKDDYGFLGQIIIIVGTLMFAKKLPQLLEELIPGLKLGGMELNPFKRIRKDALGGNLISNTAMGALGLSAGLAGSALSHGMAYASNRKKIRSEQSKLDDVKKKANDRRMQNIRNYQVAKGNLNAAQKKVEGIDRLQRYEFEKNKNQLAQLSREIGNARRSGDHAKADLLTKQRDDLKNKYFSITRPQFMKDKADALNELNNAKANVKSIRNVSLNDSKLEKDKIKEQQDKVNEYINKKINKNPIKSAAEEIAGGAVHGGYNAYTSKTDNVFKAIQSGLKGTDEAAIKRNYREDFSLADELHDKATTFARIKNESGTSSEISESIKKLNNQLTREQNNMVTLSNTLANLTNTLDNSKKTEAINIVNNINHEEFVSNYNSYNDYVRKNSNTKLAKEDFDAIYSAIEAAVQSQRKIDTYTKDIKKYTEMKEKQDKKGKG